MSVIKTSTRQQQFDLVKSELNELKGILSSETATRQRDLDAVKSDLHEINAKLSSESSARQRALDLVQSELKEIKANLNANSGSKRLQVEAVVQLKATPVTTTFADMGGVSEIEESLRPVLDWLVDPTSDLGVKVPRGVLITGPSGCGKTMLAHAIAGRTGVQLISCSGSEFTELLVGMGSARMRQLFAEASALTGKTKKPCVLLLDNIDMLAEERLATPLSELGGTAERLMTLIQLLYELDDIRANGRVYVIGTTSRPRVLDRTLLGVTRLGLRIDLPLPDERAREQILAKHLRGAALAPDVDLKRIALGTRTFTGRELAELVARAHSGDGHGELHLEDFVRARAKILPQPGLKPPSRIVEHLDKHVVGQSLAKQHIAVAISNHYQRLALANRFSAAQSDLKKSNVLMIGPTGTGKTLMIETVAGYLDVPYVIVNSTVLTEAGYAGANVEYMLYQLIAAADFNLRKAEYGIVCIDEFDKLAFMQGERTRRASAGVQQELLKLLEGTVVDVPKGGLERAGNHVVYQLDTRNILFVCLGAFNDLEAVIGQRLETAPHDADVRAKLRGQVEHTDIIGYGFLPELVGRFPIITATENLGVDDLSKILQIPRGLLDEYRSLLSVLGWASPSFAPEAVQRIASEAIERGVGARGLRSIMEKALLAHMYDPPGPGELASKPLAIDAASIDKALSKHRAPAYPRTDLSIEAIVAGLEERVPGNAQAKQYLATVSHGHYSGSSTRGARQAVLLVDPVVHRRRELVAALAEVWDVPFTVASAEAMERALISRSGSTASWLAEPLRDLMERSGQQLRRARHGIVLIDAFDQTMSRAVTDRFHLPLEQELVRFLRGKAPIGGTLDGVAQDLLVIVSGDFEMAYRLSGSVARDPALQERYAQGRLLDTLLTEFSVPAEVLEHLIPVALDLTIDESQLMKLVESTHRQVRAKYGGLLAEHSLTSEDYRQLAMAARDQNWSAAELAVKIEDLVVEQRAAQYGTDADAPEQAEGG